MVAGVVAALLAGVGVSWVLTHRESVGSAAGDPVPGPPLAVSTRSRSASRPSPSTRPSSSRSAVASPAPEAGGRSLRQVVVTSSPTLALRLLPTCPDGLYRLSPDLQDLRTKLASAALASPAPVVVGRTYTVVATPAADFAKNGWDAKTPSWAELSAAIVPPTGAPGTSVVMADPATSFASQAAMASLIATAQGNSTGQVNVAGMSAVNVELVVVLGVGRAAGLPRRTRATSSAGWPP